MTKLISIHSYSCKNKCEHADVCYFVNGKHCDVDEIENSQVELIEQAINKITGDKQIYYAGCDFIPSYLTYGGSIYGHEDERHMTFSSNHYPHMKTLASDLQTFNNNIQLTVYTLDELQSNTYYDIQKLFLIKNDTTYLIACDVIKNNVSYNKIHFPIDQKWAEENQDKVLHLVHINMLQPNDTITLDSCLMNYVINGTCSYIKEYIDLRYDGTVRRCPFSDECHSINYNEPDTMFDIPFTPNCIYHKMFGTD